jgi:hypothetical protein
VNRRTVSLLYGDAIDISQKRVEEHEKFRHIMILKILAILLNL